VDDVRADWQLGITAGLNRGARVALAPGSITMIGSAIDGDVVLADDGVAPRHLALRVDAEAVRARVFDGGAQLDGAALTPLAWHEVRAGASITLGGSDVLLVLHAAADAGPDASARAGADAGARASADADADAKASASAHVNASAGAMPAAGISPSPAARERAGVRMGPVAPRRSRRWWATLGATTTALAVGGAALAFVAAPVALEAPTREALRRLLADVPAATAVRVDDAAGVLRLNGVADATGVQALRQRLIDKQWATSVALQVVTPSQLVAATDATFRARGVHEARFTHAGAGRVQVSNADPDDPRVERAVADAKRDVPELAAITFAPYDKPKPPRAPVTDPGQRLTAIVHGPMSYVATADGKRFLIGAVLPDGHVVRAIGAQGVELERDGRRNWLNF
jgi:type III secretion protein D